MQVVMGIAGYIPPSQDALEDTMIWDKSANGRFTVKTTYMVREEDGTIERDPIWRIVWKWKGMERIRMFLWTVAHNAIMTNEMRWRRRISDNKCCCDCVNEVENLTHSLRDCPKARKIWEVFIKVEERELFFSQNWYTWLVSNLSSRDRSGSHGDWNMVFGIAMWYIWKERCSRTLGGNQGNWYGTVLAIKRMVGDSEKVQGNVYGGMNGGKVFDYIGWKYPDEDWVKLNVDGCSKGNPGKVGAGGVIRDHMGSWIGGFARNIGTCSSVTAELWAIYVGLQLTWEKGFRNVVLESNSKVVVRLLKAGGGGRNYNLIMHIKDVG